MKYILNSFCYIAFLLPFSVIAQFNYSASKLMVIIEEPNLKMEEKMNPEELKNYQLEIEQYNLQIKKYVTQLWKIGDRPQFINKSEAKNLVESKALNTLILSNTKFTNNYNDYANYKLTNKLFASKDAIVENYSKKQLPFRASSIILKRADTADDAPAFAVAPMPSIKQSEADIIYAIKSLSLQMDYRSKGTTEVQLMKLYIKNAPHLKDLTLLINSHDIDESVKTEVKVHYKLAFEMVMPEAIEKAILQADKTKAICLTIPNTDGSFSFKVFDAANMEILAQSGTIPPSEYYPELNNKIKGNHLEDFTHYCE